MSDLKSEVNKYTWIIAILAAILGLIGFFVPAVYFEIFRVEIYLWKWGYFYASGYGQSNSGFMGSDSFNLPMEDFGGALAGSIVSLILTIIAVAVLFITGFLARSDYNRWGRFWILAGALMIAAEIIWIGGMATIDFGSTEYYSLNYWDIFDVGAGIVLGVVAGSVAVLGGVIGELTREGGRSLEKG